MQNELTAERIDTAISAMNDLSKLYPMDGSNEVISTVLAALRAEQERQGIQALQEP